MKKKIVLRGDSKPHFSKMTNVFRFGKHKNETIDDVIYLDPGYILWIVDHDVATVSKELIEKAKHNLAMNDAHRPSSAVPYSYWRDDDV